MKNLFLSLLTLVALAACSAPAATPLPSPTAVPPSVTSAPAATALAPTPGALAPATATNPPRAATSTQAPPVQASPSATFTPAPQRNAPVVDASTMNGKVIFGYQGWFSCPNDGSKLGAFYHWTKRSKTFTAADLTVDNWPDMSEVTADERCPTGMKLPNGGNADVFSSYNPHTVERHFQWMKQYDLDGVAVQRFVTSLDSANQLEFRNQVLKNVRASAEANGRVFYVEYDVTGKDPATMLASLKKDWTFLVDDMKITSSPQYLHDNGLPVLQIYGLGFNSHPDVTAELGRQIVDYFKSSPAPYRVTIVGGVPSYWRTGTHDASPGPEWAAVFRSFDVLSPWSVGRFKNDADADKYTRDIVTPDLAETAQDKLRYMPVVFPGFSWKNLNQGPLNDIPRRCGAFYWRQVYNSVSAGSRMLFVAMFDEVDEGTAMFKLAPTQDQLPAGASLVPLNVDGCSLPSDWYLQLGRETGKALRGEMRSTTDMPIKPK